MSEEKTLRQHINELANKEKTKSTKPKDGDKDAAGRVYSSSYGGHVSRTVCTGALRR